MTRIKGYYTMEELAEKLGWRYHTTSQLAVFLGLSKLGKMYLIPEEEVEIILGALETLRTHLKHMRLKRLRESD